VSGQTSRLSPEEINRRRAEGTAAYRARRRAELALPQEINMLLQQMQQRGSAFVVFDRRKLVALFRGGGR
jgi:hypothetical protein